MGNFDQVYAALRQIMVSAAPEQEIVHDAPGDLVLHTRRIDPKSGKPIWFGAVAIKKSYVAYHLFPLYEDPALGKEISQALAARRQGKSCFNFKSVDDTLMAELARLTAASSASCTTG